MDEEQRTRGGKEKGGSGGEGREMQHLVNKNAHTSEVKC